MEQKFAARQKYDFGNGAIGWRPGGWADCIGPWAKVQNCPIQGTDKRLTCYATAYADTYFSIPAVTRYRGKRITGYLTQDRDGGALFVPYTREHSKLGIVEAD